MAISDERLADIASALVQLPSVVGVTLGGSRARGTHTPDSDVDLGIYVETPLDPAPFEELAHRITGAQTRVVGPGGWGPWVEGGAWLTVDGTEVDWILRDVRRVEDQVERARRGEYGFHTQAGHPLGFLDIAYAGELATARLLADPTGRLAELAARVTPYPPALSPALVGGLWEAEFLADIAAKGAVREDTAYVALALARALLLAAHALCAYAGQWVTNEKGLIAQAGRTEVAPPSWADRANRVLGNVGTTEHDLLAAVGAARSLIAKAQVAVGE